MHPKVSGVEAARTLLGEMLLSGTGMEKAAADLALYWAARAKLEEVKEGRMCSFPALSLVCRIQ